MNFEIDKNQNLLVTLNRKDMKKLQITYEELNSDNIEARRVVWTLLGEAKNFLGESLSLDDRLFIEILPCEKGGCSLIFKPSQPEFQNKLIMKKGAETILFCAFNINAFIDALKFLRHSKVNYKTLETFEFNKDFYVIIKPKLNLESKILFSLREFGEADSYKNDLIAKIYEFGKPLTNLS